MYVKWQISIIYISDDLEQRDVISVHNTSTVCWRSQHRSDVMRQLQIWSRNRQWIKDSFYSHILCEQSLLSVDPCPAVVVSSSQGWHISTLPILSLYVPVGQSKHCFVVELYCWPFWHSAKKKPNDAMPLSYWNYQTCENILINQTLNTEK